MPDGLITRVLAVRHGETSWNIAGRMQGHLDSDLDASGRAQADALGRRLAGQTIHHLYASDLGRAVETAQRIAVSTGHRFALEPGLRERHLGLFQGLTHPFGHCAAAARGEDGELVLADAGGMGVPGEGGVQA